VANPSSHDRNNKALDEVSKEKFPVVDEFSDLDRRTIGNLAIPRNVVDLTQMLRADEHTETRDDDTVQEHLLDLESRGLVVKLGDGHGYDPAKLAAGAQKEKRTIPMADEQCQILERRLAAPHLNWRVPGDQWMLSVDGLDQIKAPTVDSPPMNDQQLAATIASEWARTKQGDPAELAKNGELDGCLTEEIFLAWLSDVQAEWRSRNKGRELPPNLRGPLAGGSQFTDAYENLLLDAENQKTALGAVVDPWYMTLTILAFTDVDTGTTAADGSHIPTYTGWARIAVPGTSMPAASGTGGSVANTTAIVFAACTAGTSTILGFGNCAQLASGGVLRKFGTCASTVVSTTQTPPQFAIGAYTTTIA
jgi:hypothetical protein